MKYRPELLLRLRKRAFLRFRQQYPIESTRLPDRFTLLRSGHFCFYAPPSDPVRGLVLYGRVLQAQLRAMAADRPDWKLVQAQQRWLDLMTQTETETKSCPMKKNLS